MTRSESAQGWPERSQYHQSFADFPLDRKNLLTHACPSPQSSSEVNFIIAGRVHPFPFHLLILGPKIDIQTQRPQFLHKNVKGFRNTGFEVIITSDHGFINLCTTAHVVGLHCQHFLKCISRTISFQCPDFHFSKSLTTMLSFSS